MAAHQHSPAGGRKKSKLFTRLLSWRSNSGHRSSSRRTASPGTDVAAKGIRPVDAMAVDMQNSSADEEGESSSVRRTSPVDLNLGETATASSTTATHEMLASSPMSSALIGQRKRFNNGATKIGRKFGTGVAATHKTVTTELPSPIQPLPTLLPSAYHPLHHEPTHHHRLNILDMNYHDPPAEKEELGALRNLATELHAALRRSEDENALLKARLQTLDDYGLAGGIGSQPVEPLDKLDHLIDDLRDIASSDSRNDYSPLSSPFNHRRNLRYLGRVLMHKQAEIRRLETELTQTQTELLFTRVELDEVRRCLHRLHQRLLYTEEELEAAREGMTQASVSKQRLMQELQTTRGLLMRCWSRVRILEQQQHLFQPHSYEPR